jgi:hypothetical protein
MMEPEKTFHGTVGVHQHRIRYHRFSRMESQLQPMTMVHCTESDTIGFFSRMESQFRIDSTS